MKNFKTWLWRQTKWWLLASYEIGLIFLSAWINYMLVGCSAERAIFFALVGKVVADSVSRRMVEKTSWNDLLLYSADIGGRSHHMEYRDYSRTNDAPNKQNSK